MKATHMRTCGCGDVNQTQVGESITLCGWTQRCRKLGGLVFIALRDRSGVVQIIVDESERPDLVALCGGIKNEFVLQVTGAVALRGERDINPDMKTGYVEVHAQAINILSAAQTLPFPIDDQVGVSDELRMKYRFLDLRRPQMQQNLMLRHRLSKAVRDFFDQEGFLEIETPMLVRSTPEGARDYLVPSRMQRGAFYALPQSPQLYKQLLMVAGMDRYVQIVRCFRDEALRADRQPEFTQIDVEMSYVTAQDVMDVNERLMAHVFAQTIGYKLQLPLPRMTWKDAMQRYGSDKPDTRFGLELVDVSDAAIKGEFGVFNNAVANGGCVKAICLEDGAAKLSRRDIDALGEVVKTYRAKGLAWATWGDTLKSPIAKFFSEDAFAALLAQAGAKQGDAVFFVADSWDTAVTALGQLRLELGRRFHMMDENVYNVLWVTEFPLLEYSQEEGRYKAMHHPFTSPMLEDLDMLESDPGKVRAEAYDLVINGVEAGGGSIRIHDSALQMRAFRALGFTEEQAREQFGFLLSAFAYGTPPHGGCAFGLDRVAMLLGGAETIRDMIAFPKAQNASDLMTQAPAPVDPRQLEELFIEIAPEAHEDEA
nr:aspartate--tRNA ligase [Maliibacterium massiliense]